MAAKLPKKVAVIGFDCAEPHLIEKHIKEGHLPTFKKLIENGVIAENCLSPYPTITPPNWATIATGANIGTHGITDFHLHKHGTTPNNENTYEAFNSENCKAEFVWDALDKAGKKCIVVNYPGSWPSHMKNGIIVGGSGLTIGEQRDGLSSLNSKMNLCSDQIVTTGVYPGAIKGKFEAATGWKNATDLGEEPLEMKFDLNFMQTSEKPAPTTWYVLVKKTGKSGYDKVILAPDKDLKNAFSSIGLNEWSSKIFTSIKLMDGSKREVFFRAKLLELSEDAEDFRLLITSLCATSGWSNPPEIAGEIDSPEGIMGHSGGLLGYSIGAWDLDAYAEINELHDIWLGDVVTSLFKKHPWDLFYMHSHPPDWAYHVLMTDMDPNTCKDKEAYKKAWEIHLRIYQSQDRMLKRIVEAAGDDVLIMLVSDHGAVADGPTFSPQRPLEAAGLIVFPEESKVSLVEMEGLSKEAVAKLRTSTARHSLQKARVPDATKSKCFAQRSCHIYINLKGRDPEGIVEPGDYEKVQQQIIDTLLTSVDPRNGKRQVALALSNQDARILGMYGEAAGDVIYAVYPEFGSQHGQQLPTAEWGVGSLKSLLVINGPGIKKGYRMERTCGLTDLVPTICYLMNFPVPAQVDGAVLYQALKDPNFKMEEITRLKDTLSKMEAALSGQKNE